MAVMSKKKISLSEPYLAGHEWKQVKRCFDTGWVSSSGPQVEAFEQDICRYTKARFAVATASGTAALHAALLVTGVKPGEEVIVPTVTFIAPVNAVRYVNANPVFMDCDDYYNIDTEKTLGFIKNETIFKNGFTVNKRTGKKIRAIIVVHVFGNAVDLYPLIDICKERNIAVIEDATESLGTFYKKSLSRLHTGTVGDIGCFSFNGNKIITAGGGGMMVTNDSRYARKAKYLTNQAKDDGIYYLHHEIGFNYRLSNIQAALGAAQLSCLNDFVQRKRANYQIYKTQIDQIDGLCLAETPLYAENNYWMYALQIDKNTYGRGRDQLLQLFHRKNIEVRPLWYLNHLQRPYQKCQAYKIEKAHNMLAMTLNVPCSLSLTKESINAVVGLLKK